MTDSPGDRAPSLTTPLARLSGVGSARAERLAKLGADPMPMSMAEFEAFMRSEVDDEIRIAKAAGIKPQ